MSHGPRRQIIYDLDAARAVDDKSATIRADLEGALATQQIVATVTISMTGVITVTPRDAASRPTIEQLVKADHGDTTERRDCDGAVCIAITPRYAATIEKAALAIAIETTRARLVVLEVADATVIERAGKIVVEFPAANPRSDAIRSLIVRSGRLEFKIVDDGSTYMKQVFTHADRARDPEVAGEVDQWMDEAGAKHLDFYLVAHDHDTVTGRRSIERYLGDLAAQDPAFKIPADRQIGFERDEPPAEAKDRRPYWRTYYLDRTVQLTGAAIASAQRASDPNTNRPLVLLAFNRAGGQLFGELTARIAGKKLATILDDRIRSAPIINGAIRGGRASIMMGGSDPTSQERERDELYNVLKTGALPAPMVEVSSSIVP